MSCVAQSIPFVDLIALSTPGSSKPEALPLMRSTILTSWSTPRTLKPFLARQAAKPNPSFPSPTTDKGSARIMRDLQCFDACGSARATLRDFVKYPLEGRFETTFKRDARHPIY